jgi:hypothetical protein
MKKCIFLETIFKGAALERLTERKGQTSKHASIDESMKE